MGKGPIGEPVVEGLRTVDAGELRTDELGIPKAASGPGIEHARQAEEVDREERMERQQTVAALVEHFEDHGFTVVKNKKTRWLNNKGPNIWQCATDCVC